MIADEHNLNSNINQENTQHKNRGLDTNYGIQNSQMKILTSRDGYSSKSSNFHKFPVSGSGSYTSLKTQISKIRSSSLSSEVQYYSFTSKLGALTPRFTPPDSVLAARTTTRLGDGALTLRRRKLRSNLFDGDIEENLREEIANALREGTRYVAPYDTAVTAVEAVIVVSLFLQFFPEPQTTRRYLGQWA